MRVQRRLPRFDFTPEKHLEAGVSLQFDPRALCYCVLFEYSFERLDIHRDLSREFDHCQIGVRRVEKNLCHEAFHRSLRCFKSLAWHLELLGHLKGQYRALAGAA